MDPTAPGNTQNNSLNEGGQSIPNSTPVVEAGTNEFTPAEETNSTPIETNIPEDTIQPIQNSDIPPQEETGFQTSPSETDTVQPQDPINNEPQIITTQPQTPHEAMVDNGGRKSRKPIIFLFLAFVLILILVSFGGLTYAVAYEKIKLDKYPDLQKKVSNFVMELPFMPKTPKFLLARSAMAHQDITKQSFDISMAVDSADLASSLGLSNMDIQAKGAFDYSDPRNVFGNLELSLTKDFNIELRKVDKMLYFKLNKLPSFLFAFLGVKASNLDPILNKWVSYDTTPLDTEARTRIQEDREVDPLSEEFIDKNFEKYLDEEVLSKMSLSSDTEEGNAVYKITLDADSNMIDHLGKKIEDAYRQKSNYAYPQQSGNESEKLSDFIKKFKWEIFIDKKNFFTRKVIVSIDLEYDSNNGLGSFSMGSLISPVSSKNNAKIVLAAKFDHFGEEVIIEEPESSITIEEFSDLLSTTFNEIYGSSITSSQAQARDAKRRSDLSALRSALEMYNIECNGYPNDLNSLTYTKKSDGCLSDGEAYMSIVPSDPNGGNYYYQIVSGNESYNLCANLETPPTTPSTCPDPSFNYHLKKP